MSALDERSADRLAAELEAMASAWHRGEPIAAEEVLRHQPDLDDEAAVRLIYEEICLRREAGQDLAASELARRFPRWERELVTLLSCERWLDDIPVVRFPEVGEALGDFQLLSELGRGASGRTFLAAQPSLADRPVVLKVAPLDVEEHLHLARLQHAAIVPLYSEHRFPDRGLRALCMPDLGGSSLDRILHSLATIPTGQRRGADLVRTQDGRRDGPLRAFFERESYVRAVCALGASLADALQHAHERGLVHMDVKPSNILIADDGQPMLLDFHLARCPLDAGDRPTGRLGGTPGWMSPEHRLAFEAIEAGLCVPRPVDGRTDLYALGLVLAEALAGREATAAGATSARLLSRLNPDVSPNLADLIARCLEPEPGDRYPDAATLADDLRRHLQHRPLQGVANRSVRERWLNWRRRRPGAALRAFTAATLAIASLTTMTLVWERHRQRTELAAEALDDAKPLQSAGRYNEAARILGRARDQLAGDPLAARLTSDLERGLRLARRGQLAEELHNLADQLRFQSGAEASSLDDPRHLLDRLRLIWERPDLLARPPDATLEPAVEERLRRDVVELAVVWSSLTRTSSPRKRGLEALRHLEALEATFGPSHALDHERAALARQLGLPTASSQPPTPPRTGWEHDQLGRVLLREGRLSEALDQFRLALERDPGDFWPNFSEGLCAYRLGRPEEAVAAFRACIVLSPTSPEPFFNRALALERLGRLDQAIRDYDQALRLAPDFAPASLNRALLHYRAGRLEAARDDLRRAIASSPGRALTGHAYYNLALVELALGHPAAARASLEQAAALDDPDALAFAKRE